MLRRSVDKPLSQRAKRHTEHDQREDAEVKLQHVCLFVPRQAILGQDSEQFTANGLLCRFVPILTHLVRVEGWWQSPKDSARCQKDDYRCTTNTTQQIIKTSPQRIKERSRIYPRRLQSRCSRRYPCEPWVSAIRRHRNLPPQMPPENSTLDSRPLNLLFDRWIMWEKTPPTVEALGLCRNAISRPQQGLGGWR